MSMIPYAVRSAPYVVRAAARVARFSRPLSKFGRILRGGMRAGLVADALNHIRSKRVKTGNEGQQMPYQNRGSGGGAYSKPFRKVPRLAAVKGKYAGRFKKPRKLSRKIPKYQQKGFINTTEVNGIVTDPDCVYCGCTAITARASVEVIAQALLRKLFEKCVGVTVTNIREPLQGYHNGANPFTNADGYRISLITLEVSTNITTEESKETGINDSIFSLVGNAAGGIAPTWPGFMDQLVAYAQQGPSAAARTRIPIRLNLFRRDGNATIFYMGSGSLDLRNERVHLYGSANLKIQNRSLSASGSSDAQSVNNNPLQGYFYQFKGGVPQFRDTLQNTGTIRLNRMFDKQGALLAKASGFGAVGSTGHIYKEPPNPKMWTNCISASRVKLEPGDIKKATVSWKYSAPFMEMLEKLRIQVDGVAAAEQTVSLPGKSILFSLEDMINVNAAENIAIAYEINRTVGAYLTTGRVKIASGEYTALTLNEV